MKRYCKQYALLHLLLLLCVVMLSACINESTDSPESTTKVKEGDDIPAFTLFSSDGQEVSSASLKGQVYILSFFDTGCPDCQQELKVLQRIYDKYHTVVPVLNVPRSQTKDEVQTYWEKVGLSMPYHMADNKELYYEFATKTIPRTYIVDDRGKVCATFTDSPIADFNTLDAILQEKVSEADARRGSVNMSIKLKMSASGVDKDAESTISRLEMFFFNSATKQLFSRVLVNMAEAERFQPTEKRDSAIYYLKNFRIHAGVYDIFTIANYDYCPEDIKNEDKFLNMIDSITYKEGIMANLPDKGPVMTSKATAFLDIDLRPWADKTDPYPLTVNMERVMAKLEIGVEKNSYPLIHDGTQYAEINITNYKLVNLNRQYYLFQHTDNLPMFAEQPIFTLPTHFSDYKDQGQQYVVDPFFYQKTTNTEHINKPREYYRSWFGEFSTEDFASMPSAKNYVRAYILENTAYKTFQKNGYSPGIIFKGAVTPSFVYLYDTDIMQLKKEYSDEYWPETIYLYKYNFYGSIQAINMASGLKLDALATYSDKQLKTYGIKQCKINNASYETYYAYWIEHHKIIRANGGSEEMQPMEYGAVRNYFYRLHVDSITGLGHSRIEPDIMRDNYPNSYTDVVVDITNP